MILATILEDYNGIIQTIETFVSEEGADLVVRSICDMLTKEANRKLRCDISESKKSVQKIEKEARRAVEVLSNKETVAVQIEENFKNNPKFQTEIFFFDLTLILESWKKIQNAGPSPRVLRKKIQSAALRRFVYVSVLWIFFQKTRSMIVPKNPDKG